MEKEKSNKPKSGNYWSDLFWPATAGLLTQEATLGYFLLKGQIPSQHQAKNIFDHAIAKSFDGIPYSHLLGKPALVSTIAGIAVASSSYYAYRYLDDTSSAAQKVSEPHYEGQLKNKECKTPQSP